MQKRDNKQIVPLAIFGVSVFIFLLCRFGSNILNGGVTPIDFSVYYSAWKAFLAGNNMYGFPAGEGMVFKYAPYFGIIFSPLGLLPYNLAAFGWAMINSAVFAVGLSAFYFIKFKKIGASHYIAFSLLGIIFIFRSLMPEMKVGNTNLMVLGLFLLFTFFYLRGRVILGALFFTLLAYIKLGPLLILLHFIKRRDLRFIFWFGIFSIILVVFLPFFAVLSFERGAAVFQEWQKSIFTPLPQSIIHLQSLKLLVLRYLTPSEIFNTNFLSLPRQAALFIYYLMSAALIICALFYKGWADKGKYGAGKELALIDINLLLILSVILSPASSYLNYVFLFSPLLILFLIAWGNRERQAFFFRLSFLAMVFLSVFTRNSFLRKVGIFNLKGEPPYLLLMIWPVTGIILFVFLCFLRKCVLKGGNNGREAGINR